MWMEAENGEEVKINGFREFLGAGRNEMVETPLIIVATNPKYILQVRSIHPDNLTVTATCVSCWIGSTSSTLPGIKLFKGLLKGYLLGLLMSSWVILYHIIGSQWGIFSLNEHTHPQQCRVYQWLPPEFGSGEDGMTCQQSWPPDLLSWPIGHSWDQLGCAIHTRVTSTNMLSDLQQMLVE